MVLNAVFPSDKDACFKWFAKVSTCTTNTNTVIPVLTCII